MLSRITPERFDTLLLALAAITTTVIAFALIWLAMFVF